MSSPIQPQFDPQAAWEALVANGLSKQEAAVHVARQVANQPTEIRAQYLKDIDPGKLASFGLGAADMMSFGLGNQVARGLLGETATMTQEQAQAQQPTAHFLGEAAGLVGPGAIAAGVVKGLKVAPTAIGAVIRGIKNKALRSTARLGASAASGAALGGAQAAGRTEGNLGERAHAAKRGAAIGAVVGAIPVGAGIGYELIRGALRLPGRLARRAAYGPAAQAGAPAPQVQPVPGLLGIGEEITGRGIPRPLTPRAPSTDPLDIPAFQRRGPNAPRPGHPTYSGEAAPTRSLEVRGGEPLLPKANPTVGPVMAKLRQLSSAQLVEAWKNAPQELRDLLLVEFQRRRITIPDLGIAPARGLLAP